MNRRSMCSIRSNGTLCLFVLLVLSVTTVSSFAPSSRRHPVAFPRPFVSNDIGLLSLKAIPSSATMSPEISVLVRHVLEKTHMVTAAVPAPDPEKVLSNVLSGFIGGPGILAVPIVAGFAVASLLAAFIVGYANPSDEDDD